MPDISVVIPVYNVEKYLRQCLDSACAQTMKNIEFICVDDASPDNCPAILDEFAKRDGRIKVLHLPENGGAANARNVGVRNASGKYTMFLDADDFFNPDSCARAFELIEQHQTDVVHFNNVLYSDGKISPNLSFLEPCNGLIEGENLLDACFVEWKFTNSMVNKIYRTKLLQQAVENMTDERIEGCEDIYQFFIMMFFCKSYYGVKSENLYNYRFMVGRDSQTPDFVFRTAGIIPYVKAFLEKQNAFDRCRAAFDGMCHFIKMNSLGKLLQAPQLDRELLKSAVKYHGSDILIDFIEAIGVSNVQTDNRYNLCGNLLKMVADRDAAIAKLRNSGGGNSRVTYSFK